MDDYDNNDYGMEFDEYNDQDATDCANGDYNVLEEREICGDKYLEMDYEDRNGCSCEEEY